MPQFYAVFGNTPELSGSELSSLLAREIPLVTPHLGALGEMDAASATKLMSMTGGVVKLCQELTQFPSADEKALLAYLVERLSANPKPTFCLSQLLEQSVMPITAGDVKRELQNAGLTCRYIEPTSTDLSAAVLLHHPNVQEFFLIRDGEIYRLLLTTDVQDIDAWTKRDRHKPYADRKKGMLPPKVARMMVNLAQHHPLWNEDEPSSAPVMFDPFCGSGTILLEARMSGWQVLGADIDRDATLGTQKNLAWFEAEYHLPTTPASAILTQTVSDPLPTSLPKVDAIVTEPFLGKPTPQTAQLAGIFKGLEKLYLGAFKRWTTILKPGGEVVIVFPTVVSGKYGFTLTALIDKLSQIGYTTTLGPVLYHRPNAIVQRQIYRFKYQPANR